MILTEERATAYDHRGILKKYRVYLTYNRIFFRSRLKTAVPSSTTIYATTEAASYAGTINWRLHVAY